MYIEIPAVEGTPESRIAALKESRELLKGEPKVTAAGMFASAGTIGGDVAGPGDLIRLATYIETGHDYRDTHPEGKRRPIIKNTHVTVMAPQGMSPDVEHLLSHLGDGSFAEFLEDLIKEQSKPETADDEKSAKEGPTT